MASRFTTYAAQTLAAHVWNGTSWTPPTTWYLRMHVDDPGDSGTANPSAVATRQPMTLSTPDSNGLVTITADITWSMTTGETITYVSGWDAVSAGHCWFLIELDEGVNEFSGDTFDLPTLGLQLLGISA